MQLKNIRSRSIFRLSEYGCFQKTALHDARAQFHFFTLLLPNSVFHSLLPTLVSWNPRIYLTLCGKSVGKDKFRYNRFMVKLRKMKLKQPRGVNTRDAAHAGSQCRRSGRLRLDRLLSAFNMCRCRAEISALYDRSRL